MSELGDWLQPEACPAERPPLSSMSERTRQLARQPRRARAAERTALSPSRRAHRPTGPLRVGAGDRVAGGQGRVHVRRRGLLVRTAASLCPLWHHVDGRADRARQGAGARGRRARVRLRHAGHRARVRRADGRRPACRADASGLQQDALVPGMAGQPRRRDDHHRRRRGSRGAGGGDHAGDGVRLRRDLHQPAGARPGSGPVARGRRRRLAIGRQAFA